MRAVEDLGAFLEGPEPGPALDTVVAELARLIGAEIGCAYRFGVGASGVQLDLLHTHGAPERLRPLLEQFASSSSSTRIVPTYDALHPAEEQRNVAILASTLVPRSVWETASFTHDVLRPLDLEHHEHVRVLVCDGSLLLGWVGVLGTGRYGAREIGILDALAAPLARRLRRDQRLRTDAVGRAAFDVLVERLEGPAFLVCGDRVVVHANANGRRLLESGAIDLASRIAEARAGRDADLELHPLALTGMPPHVLVVVKPRQRSFEARLADVRARWRLTPRQTQVLARLVRGEANKTIAEQLRCAVVTVEVHVTALLRKADVDSRAAIVARFWAAE